MAEERVTIIITLTDDATKGLGKVADGLDDVGDEAKQTDKQVGLLGRGLDKLKSVGSAAGKGLGALTVGVGALTAGAVAAGAAAAALVSVTGELLGKWEEQTTAVGGLADSLARTGLEGEALRSELSRINNLAGSFSLDTLFGDENVFKAVDSFTRLSGDARIEVEQLDVILGIASKTNKEASEAAEIYAKALKGDIGPIKDLTALTVKQEQELGKLTGTQEQAAFVTEILAAQYGGLAQKVDPTTNAIKNFSDSLGDSQQALGGIISSSGVVGPLLDGLTRAFRFVEAAIYDNSEALQQWVVDTVLSGVDTVLEFNEVLIENADFLAGVSTVSILVGKTFRILIDTVQLLAQAIRVVVATSLAGLVEGFKEVVSLGAELAESVGETGLAKELRIASGTAGALAEELAGSALAGMQGIKDEAIEATKRFDEFGEVIANTEERSALARKGLELTRDNLKQVRKELEEARKNIKPIDATTVRAPTSGFQAPPDATKIDPSKEEKIAKAKERAAKALREEVVALQLRAALDNDAERSAVLEYQAELAQIRGKDLTDSERKLELVRAAIGLETELERIQDERAKTDDERRKKELEDLKAISDAYGGVGDAIRSVTTGISEIDAVGAALGGLSDVASNTFDAFTKGGEAAAKAAVSALSAAGSAVSGIAEATGASARTQAAILAIFEAAQAAASFATGLIPQGIQHTIAAGLYATAAGTSAPSSGAGAPSAAASGSATAGGGLQATDPREIFQLQAEAIANALGGGGEAGGVTIIVDQRESINGTMTPEMERRITRGVVRGLEASNYNPELIRR